MMRTVLLTILVASFLSACGTFRTVPEKSQLKLKYSSKLNSSPCKKIPRIYSGVIFDGCMLIGTSSVRSPEENYYYFMSDVLFSIVADTAVLPYTIYGQINYGNIPISQSASMQPRFAER